MKYFLAWLVCLVCFFFWTVVLIYTGNHLTEMTTFGQALCVTILMSPVFLWAIAMIYVGTI